MIDEVLTLIQELSYLLLWLLDHQKWMQLDYHTAGPAIELSIFTFDLQQFCGITARFRSKGLWRTEILQGVPKKTRSKEIRNVNNVF